MYMYIFIYTIQSVLTNHVHLFITAVAANFQSISKGPPLLPCDLHLSLQLQKL
ncbi:hypothetical protein Scep_017948 [Stephania cephalantha]|uniref:Uncharacterized protein n=1 Tax=Stephania cephalantha TaxID=152367 RepID=A0AAP0IR18_9MAGN